MYHLGAQDRIARKMEEEKEKEHIAVEEESWHILARASSVQETAMSESVFKVWLRDRGS